MDIHKKIRDDVAIWSPLRTRDMDDLKLVAGDIWAFTGTLKKSTESSRKGNEFLDKVVFDVEERLKELGQLLWDLGGEE